MSPTDAKKYIAALDLPAIPITEVHQGPGEDAAVVFDKAKNQAQVVGSGLFSFTKGVTDEVRTFVSDSALLAQLVANKKFSVETQTKEWFNAYAEVLTNVGWVLQSGEWNDYKGEGTIAEVHEQVVAILTTVLSGAAALPIITSAVDALKKMQPGSSWLTIFSRETQKARIARFQVGLVEQAANADAQVTLLYCIITAQKSITQVLVFKFKAEKAAFKASVNKVSINSASIKNNGTAIQQRVLDFQNAFMSSIKDLQL